MVGISHWGMFDARDIPYRFFPLKWDGVFDTEFEDRQTTEAEFLSLLLGRKVTAVYCNVPIIEVRSIEEIYRGY